MTISSDFQFAKKVALSYSENPSEFSPLDFSIANDISSAELIEHFPAEDDLFSLYYLTLPNELLNVCQSIDGWEDFSLSEKLTMLIHSSFDEFSEVLPFVSDTFNRIVRKSDKGEEVREKTVGLLKSIFSEDRKSSSYLLMAHFDFVYEFYFTEYGHLVMFWLKDASDGKEKSFALVDKLTSFVQEVVYNNVLDRGIDLARFFIDNNIVKLPFNISSWFR